MRPLHDEHSLMRQVRIMETNRRVVRHMSERSLRRRIRASLIATVVCLLAAGILAIFLVSHAHAMDHGFDPSAPATKWFESLQRPDMTPPSSCCGKADAYPVDRYEDNHDGTFTVWVADGSAIKYPDGAVREFYDVSVPVILPSRKVNRLEDDQDNPTEHGWIFMRGGYIYCFVRHISGS